MINGREIREIKLIEPVNMKEGYWKRKNLGNKLFFEVYKKGNPYSCSNEGRVEIAREGRKRRIQPNSIWNF